MPKIQVPPELLIQVAEKFRLQSLQMGWRISSLDHQMNTMLMWEGTTRQRFFEDFHKARSEMNLTIEYMNSISDELKRIAYRFILVDEELLPLALVGRTEEPKTWLEKAWGSLKKIGNGIMDASNERYDKRYSSVWGFLDYWTAGIPKGAYQGYVERADKLFDSPNDFANGMTFGIHGTIREAIFPTKAWSTEHVASIIGAAGIATGATVPLMKPKDILSPKVKYEVRKGNDGLKHDAGGDGGGAPKADGPKKAEPIKEVEIVDHNGKPIGEFDEIDLENGIFYEDKAAKGLDVINPKTGLPAQTPQQFTDKQILGKTRKRINNIAEATATRATKDGTSDVPSLDQIKDIRKFIFRLDGDTPELRQAVENSLKQLRKEFPGYIFDALFGGGK
ncbi:WXG100 family type VII secretion target [Paenibacillus solani]|uniref:WXG100 family type VII secretion target n=1 Tax=Paenibacillus solani TaxID=1705565 RepID=UPI003D27BA45